MPSTWSTSCWLVPVRPTRDTSGRSVSTKNICQHLYGGESAIGTARNVVESIDQLSIAYVRDDRSLSVSCRARWYRCDRAEYQEQSTLQNTSRPTPGLGFLELARHDQHDVVRPIEFAVKGLQSIDGNAFYIALIANRTASIVMPVEGRRLYGCCIKIRLGLFSPRSNSLRTTKNDLLKPGLPL